MKEVISFIEKQARKIVIGLVAIILAPFSFILFALIQSQAGLVMTMLALTLIAFLLGHIIKKI